MPIYKPSLKMMHCLLTTESHNTLAIPLTVLAVGVLAQVEATIELTNRICDKYLPPACGVSSSAA